MVKARCWERYFGDVRDERNEGDEDEQNMFVLSKSFSPSEGRFGEMSIGFLDSLYERQEWQTARERRKGGYLFGCCGDV